MTNITNRMNGARWNKDLFTDFWMAGYSADFELKFAFNNDNEFIGTVRKIFPTLSGWVDP